MLLHLISSEFLPQAPMLQEELHITQFLMNLHPEFEPVHAAFMNRENTPDLDTCAQEVFREEIRLVCQYSLSGEPKALFTTPAPATIPTPANDTLFLLATAKTPQCFECKGMGTWLAIAERNYSVTRANTNMSRNFWMHRESSKETWYHNWLHWDMKKILKNKIL